MTQYVQSVNPLVLVIDAGNQPALVAANVEHDAASHVIGTPKSLSNIGKVLPLGSPCYRVPSSQRTFPFLALFPGFFELPPTDYPHKRSSHIAKLPSIDFGNQDRGFKEGPIPKSAPRESGPLISRRASVICRTRTLTGQYDQGGRRTSRALPLEQTETMTDTLNVTGTVTDSAGAQFILGQFDDTHDVAN
jgi:hypothetical protein